MRTWSRVSAPDGLGFCTCDLCKKQAGVTELKDIGQGVYFGTNPDGQEVSMASETIFDMANQVAKAVAEKYPGKYVGILATAPTRIRRPSSSSRTFTWR